MAPGAHSGYRSADHRKGGSRMAIYALDDYVPQLPPAGRYWVAPEAHVIGRVRLGLDVGTWFGAGGRARNDTNGLREGPHTQENPMLHTRTGIPIRDGRHR